MKLEKIDREKIGNPIKTTFILHSAKGREDDKDVLYFSVTGYPPTFVVYDVNKKEMIRKIKHTSESLTACWTHLNYNDEAVYMADAGLINAQVLKYDVKTKKIEKAFDLSNAIAAYHLSKDDYGNIYCGSASQGEIFSYNTEDKSVKSTGRVTENEKYVISLSYCNGKIYGGSRSDDPKFFSIDVKTNEKEYIRLPEEFIGNVNVVYYMTAVNEFVFPILKLNDGSYKIICYNTKNNKWENIKEGSLGGQHMSEPLNDITYFIDDKGYMKGINLKTLKVTDTGILYFPLNPGDDSIDYANGLMGGGFYKLSDQEKYPGYTYITSNYDNNSLAYINMENKTVEFVNNDTILKNPVQIKALSRTYDGNIIMGGYMGTKGALYDVDNDKIKEFYCHQTEGITLCGKKNYFGVYTRAAMWEFDPDLKFEKNVNPKIIGQIGEHQDRPFALCEADNKVVFGSIPDYYCLGGAITLYDPLTKEKKVWRNVIKNQSITGVTYIDGILYGSTGVWGGLSTVPKEKEAKVFAFDLNKGKVIKENTLKFPFYKGDILHIGGLEKDCDGNLWGITSGTLFSLNKETLEVEKYVNISGINWDVNVTTWKPFSLVIKGDYIYCNPDNKLALVNKKTLQYISSDEDCFMLTMGKDNNIYYCNGSNFLRWNISGKEDEVMKEYVKPILSEKRIIQNENVSSLNDWLNNNELTDAGITTYIVNS